MFRNKVFRYSAQAWLCAAIYSIFIIAKFSVAVAESVAPSITQNIDASPDFLSGKFLPEDRDYLSSEDYLRFVKQKFVELEPAARNGECHDVVPLKREFSFIVDHLLISRPPDGKTPLIRAEEFASSPYSNKFTGAWSETWVISICNRAARRGMVVMKTVGGELQAIPQVPGTTLTDLRLQIDTLRIGLPSFSLPNCQEKNFTIMDVQVLDASNIAKHSWSEKWTLLRCGQPVTRVVNYGPGANGNPRGTTITVSSAPIQ